MSQTSNHGYRIHAEPGHGIVYGVVSFSFHAGCSFAFRSDGRKAVIDRHSSLHVKVGKARSVPNVMCVASILSVAHVYCTTCSHHQ